MKKFWKIQEEHKMTTKATYTTLTSAKEAAHNLAVKKGKAVAVLEGYCYYTPGGVYVELEPM